MRVWVTIAALNGLMAVALGAYAAHGLAGDPAAARLAERASEFQLWHALALLAADRLAAEGRPAATAAAALFVTGTLLFSGTLYWKALAGAMPLPLVTPAGGICLMLGWAALAGAGLSRRKD